MKKILLMTLFGMLLSLTANTKTTPSKGATNGDLISYFVMPSADQVDQKDTPEKRQPAPLSVKGNLVFEENFDGITNGNWNFANAGQTNKWYIDRKAVGNATNCAYISNSGGVQNGYEAYDSSTTHIYTTISIPVGADFVLNFDWKANGEINRFAQVATDYLRVSLLDEGQVPQPGTEIENVVLIPVLNKNLEWKTASIYLPASLVSGKKKVLVFSWTNDKIHTDTVAGPQPPAAIDNIKIYSTDCNVPTNLSATTTHSNINLSWVASGTSFKIAYREKGTTAWIDDLVSVSSTNAFTIGDYNHRLEEGIEYEVRVQNFCENNMDLWSNILTCKMKCAGERPFPIEQNFDNSREGSASLSNAPACWSFDMEIGQGIDLPTAYVTRSEYFSTSKSYCLGGKQLTINANSSLISPFFFASTDTIQIRFKAKSTSDNMKLKVGFFKENMDKSSFVEVENIDIKSSWGEYVVSLETQGYLGNIAAIFKYQTGIGNASVFIDDIFIEKISSCKVVTNLRVAETGITASTIKIEYDAENNASSFNIQYRELGKNDWSDTKVSTSSQYTIDEGLNPGTSYEIQVQTVCYDDSKSRWSMPLVAKTSCENAQLNILEDFDNIPEGETLTDRCWYIYKQNPADTKAEIVTTSFFSKPKSFEFQNGQTTLGTNSFILATPVFAGPINNCRIRFMAKTASEISRKDTYLEVGYLITPEDHSSFVVYDTIEYTTGTSFYNYTVSFDTSTYQGETISLAFRVTLRSVFRSLGIDNIHVELLPECPDVTNIKVQKNTKDSIYLAYESDATKFKVEYRKKDSDPTWEQRIVEGNPIGIGGLDANTLYEMKMLPICEATSTEGYWSEIISGYTTLDTLQLPFVENFEDEESALKWVRENGSQKNQWHIGSATYEGLMGKSAYISNDFGITNQYDLKDAPSIVQMYRDIKFPEGPAPYGYTLGFDWKSKGEDIRDVLKVYMVSTLEHPTAGNTVKASLFSNPYDTSKMWIRTNLNLSDTLAGKVARLVFQWENDNSTVTNNKYFYGQPPAAIDNIEVRKQECRYPTNLLVSNIGTDTAKVAWSCLDGDSYTIEYRSMSTLLWQTSLTTTDKSIILRNLQPNTDYQVRIKANCTGTDGSVFSENLHFTTLCGGQELPFEQRFDIIPTRCWNKKAGELKSDNSAVVFAAVNEAATWKYGDFINKPGVSTAATLDIRNGAKEWLFLPEVDLGTSGDAVLEFNLALVKHKTPGDPPQTAGRNDKFAVLLSTDGATWTMNDTLALWSTDANAHRSFGKISSSESGELVKIPLTNKTGKVNIAFYGYTAITAAADIGNDVFVDNIYVRIPKVCNPLNEVQVSAVGKIATATWAAPVDVKEWEVTCQKKNNTEKVVIIVENTPTAKFSNLEREATYTISVRSICGPRDTSMATSSAPFTIRSCNEVQNVKVIMEDTNVTIKWTAALGQDKWQVLCAEQSQTAPAPFLKIVETTPEVSFLNLKRGSSYIVSIRPICLVGDTGDVVQTNKFEISRCGMVRNVLVTEQCATTAAIEFTASFDQVKWQLAYAPENTENYTLKVVTEKMDTIKDLESKKIYDLRVRPICNTDTGSFSPIVKITTDSCRAVDTIYAIREPDSVYISFTENGCHQRWDVKIVEKGMDMNNILAYSVTHTGESAYKIDDNTKSYYIYVRGYCAENNFGEWKKIESYPLSLKPMHVEDNVKVVLSPNPAKDYTKLSIRGVYGDVQMRVITSTGNVVQNEKFACYSDCEKEILLQGLPKGTYLIRLMHKDWVKTEKLVVQ